MLIYGKYSRVSNKRTCTLMIFQSRCHPIRSYLNPIRLCFRTNILANIYFKNSKATFALMISIKEQIHLQNINIKRFIDV